jgi:hypothetical protein
LTRLKPRFSIRDLLWLTALLAMGLGWLVDRSQLRFRLTVAEDANYLEYEGNVSTYERGQTQSVKWPDR